MTRASDLWKRVTVSGLLVLLVTSGRLPAESSSSLAEHESFAFVHASVIPMDEERVLPDQTVIVRDGRISKIGSSATTQVPEGVTQIDATDRYLIPGLCDMHVHVLGEAWNMLLPPGEGSQDDELDMGSLLFPYLANGVTTVQVLSATEDQLTLRDRINQGEIFGPRLILAQMIDAPERAWPPPLSTWVASPEAARAAVLDAKEAGYDAMKVYSFLDQTRYDSIVAAAHEVDMDEIGHIPMALSLEYVVEAGQRLIAHSEEVMKDAGGDYSRQNIDHLVDIGLTPYEALKTSTTYPYEYLGEPSRER